MKYILASILIASVSGVALAQAPAKPAARPAAAKPAATKPAAAGPAAVTKASQTRRQAIEEAIPLEDADPADKLNAAELEVAKRVHVGEIACELGAKIVIKPRRRDGYFLVQHGINRFVMHPVESRTGAIRLEDSVRGGLFIQLGNKSMLMNQHEGKRLADDCVSPEQAAFAKNMKPGNLLEAPPPAAPVAPAAAAAPTAAPAAPAAAAPIAAPAATAPAAAPDAPKTQ